MVVECSFGSIITKFHFLGKTIETSVENAVYVITAVTLVHNVIRDLQGMTELDVQT
jgi:hypothetical protein